MPNLVGQHYDTSSSHYILCIDITLVGHYGEVFVIMDLASRCVVGHCYSSMPLDTDVICEVLIEVIRKRSFLPEIRIIHSDRGSIFKNKYFLDCLAKNNITPSRGSSTGHDNQVIERFFRTLKNRIRSNLRPNWLTLKEKGLSWDPLKEMEVSVEEFTKVVKQAIEDYNSTPHAYHKRQASPNDMEEALFLKHGKDHPEEGIPLTGQANSQESFEIEAYKAQALEVYKAQELESWPQFFIHWRLEQKAAQERTEQLLEASHSRYETLYEQYLTLQAKLEEVHQESMRKKTAYEAKQARSLKRQEAKKQPLRATISLEEFQGIIKLVRGRFDLTRSRRRLALAILYLTGLRVSNLLVLSVLNCRELLSEKKTTISLIKGGAKRHQLVLTKKGRQFLKNFYADYHILSVKKKGSDLIFSSPKDNDVPFNHELFERELNKILSKASYIYEKHIRTHSFRATFITELLTSVPIDDVKELVGHKSIATTLEYKRSRHTHEQKLLFLKTLDDLRTDNKEKDSV